MLKQKEDVLLMVKHVRYKKVDGTLYVNSGRVAWRNQTSDSFRISAKFEDIRIQRISPDQKEKVQLQLLMHSGESFTFQFSDPGGREKQLEMRNNVKAMLQNLLPKFKDKAQAELKEKFRLLESNPEILALYKELVVSGILSSEEFWARPEFSHNNFNSSQCLNNSTANNKASGTTGTSEATPNNANMLSHNNPSNGPTSQISRSFQLDDRPQVIGVPSCLLSDIKPEADGANGIKYNLTHETINAIFRAYPTVRDKHREMVPDKLSEADFWIKFFQSHYFHRDRVHLPKNDIFADCAGIDDKLLLSDIRKSRVNRNNVHLDLPNLTDYDIGQGYGIDQISGPTKIKSADSVSHQSVENTLNEPAIPSNLSANQLLLRRFNNHSILVLKSLSSNDASSSTNNASQNPKDVLNSCPLKDRVYVKELVEDQNPTEIQLDLTCVTDYLEGPTPSIVGKATKLMDPLSVTRQTDTSFYGLQLEQSVKKCKNLMVAAYHMGKKPGVSLLTALESQQALADVSPGGCLIGGKLNSERTKPCDLTSDQSSLRLFEPGRNSRISNSPKVSDEHHAGDDVDRGPPLLTPEQVKDLSLLYSSAAELLRHFWACFPVTTPQLADKLDRVAASLVRFRTTKVTHFAAGVDPSLRTKSDTYSSDSSEHLPNTGNPGPISYRSSVTSHLESMLDSAQKKYSEWKTRHT
ncbi:unnamed protein product [Schistosoma bovis]|uniref:Transcription initiation factor TFIIH subunit 1 n=1 Tax=Schistosoma bovis TaxID=6184 RepID=A0A430QK12_SCHBO|nr:transcription initiation factor TFIIH subunit 1 [Schistosoma bovis]CAH8647813.1 unnamed protein product [Schistosoma bovis]CAH8653690.1 unnamed protein product [Schistosoma bovis]